MSINPDQNDQRLILHIIECTSFTSGNALLFVIFFFCNYSGGGHVAVATWPCIYLLIENPVLSYPTCLKAPNNYRLIRSTFRS